MAKVELKGVGKVYEGTTRAVTDANITVEDKEFCVFVGPSGCGKSTTLRMVAGLEDITEGKLYIDGVEMNDVPPKDRDIAMVFQNYALYPHMTVYDNMAFGLKIRKMDKAEIDRRVKDAAKQLDLTQYLFRSEQTPSSVGLGVLVGIDGNVRASGGFIVQPLPGASEKALSRLEKNLAAIRPVSSMVDDGCDAKGIIAELLAGFDICYLETTELFFQFKTIFPIKKAYRQTELLSTTEENGF